MDVTFLSCVFGHVFEVTEEKWNCDEAEGSETIIRKASNSFSHNSVLCIEVILKVR